MIDPAYLSCVLRALDSLADGTAQPDSPDFGLCYNGKWLSQKLYAAYCGEPLHWRVEHDLGDAFYDLCSWLAPQVDWVGPCDVYPLNELVDRRLSEWQGVNGELRRRLAGDYAALIRYHLDVNNIQLPSLDEPREVVYDR